MISILLPLHNGREFLSDSIPSVLSQTHTDFELLIGINGHSPQLTADITEQIKGFKDKRIKTLFLRHRKGKVNALNSLSTSSSGKYTALIDVDDVWLPTKLEEQIPFLSKYDVVGSDVEYIGSRSGSPELFLGKLGKDMFSHQNPVVNSSAIMKKKDAHWDEKMEGLDDYGLWIHLLNKGRSFYNVPNVLIQHRIHEESFFNGKNKDMGEELKSKLPKLTRAQRYTMHDILENRKWIL